jgi:hypothetical protein
MGFAQYDEQRHAHADEVRDSRGTTVGLTLTQSVPDLAGSPSVGVRLSWTQEKNLRLRSDLSRNTPLVRLYAAVTPVPALRVAAGLTAYQQHYLNQDLVFETERKDYSVSADLVANYALDNRWSVRADAVWAVNRSNQDLYDTSRKSVSLKLRYQY